MMSKFHRFSKVAFLLYQKRLFRTITMAVFVAIYNFV
jgi:hypothetical protein